MLRLEKVATPLTAATVTVPDRVPLLGLVRIAIVTPPVKAGVAFPSASRAVTASAGAIAAPAVALVGSTVNASWLGAPRGVSKGAPPVGGRPAAAAGRGEPPAPPVVPNGENVAPPLTAGAGTA